TGWLDENPGNRQLVFSTGNFNIARGDTQEVVIIMTAGLGADRLASVNAMKFFARKASEMAKLNFVSKVDEQAKNDLPKSLHLYQNFPNPFNSSTVIQYALTAESRVKLTIYDISGKEVKRLLDENQNAGRHLGIWDGRDNRGEMITSGVYFYKIEVGGIIRSGKMILIR
ncbi:T9SS type A sorting domain-containing protein, partial [candidate division KSB1 bacterium]|nr:T9SS type A sorting domain-containing protein [candidate division KSB1 bacterium]